MTSRRFPRISRHMGQHLHRASPSRELRCADARSARLRCTRPGSHPITCFEDCRCTGFVASPRPRCAARAIGTFARLGSTRSRAPRAPLRPCRPRPRVCTRCQALDSKAFLHRRVRSTRSRCRLRAPYPSMGFAFPSRASPPSPPSTSLPRARCPSHTAFHSRLRASPPPLVPLRVYPALASRRSLSAPALPSWGFSTSKNRSTSTPEAAESHCLFGRSPVARMSGGRIAVPVPTLPERRNANFRRKRWDRRCLWITRSGGVRGRTLRRHAAIITLRAPLSVMGSVEHGGNSVSHLRSSRLADLLPEPRAQHLEQLRPEVGVLVVALVTHPVEQVQLHVGQRGR